MAKLAVIGDKETTLGFKAIGADVFNFTNEEELYPIYKEISKNEYELIFVTEKAYLTIKEELKEFEEKSVPAVLIIPSSSGDIGIAESYIDKVVQKAVGTKL